VVAGSLKAFLRELPDPLIPMNLYKRFITDGRAEPAKANAILQELPELNRKIALFIINFLISFLNPEYVTITKMGIEVSFSLPFLSSPSACSILVLTVPSRWPTAEPVDAVCAAFFAKPRNRPCFDAPQHIIRVGLCT